MLMIDFQLSVNSLSGPVHTRVSLRGENGVNDEAIPL